MVNLDHSPILQPASDSTCCMRFKFESTWQEHPNFNNVLASCWNSSSNAGDCWNDFSERVHRSKDHLSQWQTFNYKQKEIEKLSGQLKTLLNRPQWATQWDYVSSLRRRIDELWTHEETYRGQRSRVKWLNNRDGNSKIFHTSTIQRRDKNTLVRIKNDSGN